MDVLYFVCAGIHTNDHVQEVELRREQQPRVESGTETENESGDRVEEVRSDDLMNVMLRLLKLKKFFMIKILFSLILAFNMLQWSSASMAKGVYLEPELFLEQVFANNPPKPDKIWITKKVKADIYKILGHDLGVIRLRYWDDTVKRAWILEEIGRDKPITVGLVTANGKIEQINVLIFRESRGWEVKYPFFTDQYKESSLIAEYQLDRKIDGISGATLSVNAVTKLARLALYLESQVSQQ